MTTPPSHQSKNHVFLITNAYNYYPTTKKSKNGRLKPTFSITSLLKQNMSTSISYSIKHPRKKITLPFNQSWLQNVVNENQPKATECIIQPFLIFKIFVERLEQFIDNLINQFHRRTTGMANFIFPLLHILYFNILIGINSPFSSSILQYKNSKTWKRTSLFKYIIILN